MTTISTVKFRTNLTEALGRVLYGHERITVTKSGRPVAAVISMEDLEFLQAMEDRIDRKAIEKARAEGGSNSLDDVIRELGIKLRCREIALWNVGLDAPPTTSHQYQRAYSQYSHCSVNA